VGWGRRSGARFNGIGDIGGKYYQKYVLCCAIQTRLGVRESRSNLGATFDTLLPTDDPLEIGTTLCYSAKMVYVQCRTEFSIMYRPSMR